jgi:membrane protein DedA with SNARE-associated domain
MMDALATLLHTIWNALQRGQLPELGYWSYPVLSLLIVLQGPAMTLLGAAAAAAGLLKLPLVFLAGAAGNLVADSLWYFAGRAGRPDWVLRFTRPERRPAVERRIEQLSAGMRRDAAGLVLAAKLSVGLVVPTLIAVGLARVPWRRWFPIAFLGETLWTGSLTVLGYLAAVHIGRLSGGARFFGLVASILFLATVIWLARRRWAHTLP